jgi:hypothetical protein
MNVKVYGSKRSWASIKFSRGICLTVLRKTTKIFSPAIQAARQVLNPGPPEYEARMLTNRLQRQTDTAKLIDVLL